MVKYCLKPVRANTHRGDLAAYLQLRKRLEMDADLNALGAFSHMAACKVVPTQQEVRGDTFDVTCNAIQMEEFTPLNRYLLGKDKATHAWVMGRQLYILIEFGRKNIILEDSKWINWAYHEERLIMIDLGGVTCQRLKNQFPRVAQFAMASFTSAPRQFLSWAVTWLAQKTKLAAPNKLPSREDCEKIKDGLPMQEVCPEEFASTMNVEREDIVKELAEVKKACAVINSHFMAAVRVGSGRVKYSGGSGGSGGPCQAVQRFRRFRSNILTVRQCTWRGQKSWRRVGKKLKARVRLSPYIM